MISVIIPVYNVRPYLDECVRSVLGQSCADIECILVDDGSTDGSGALCDQWQERDARVRVIHQANQGVSTARNVGIDAATGEYLYFIDADDWCEVDIFKNVGGQDAVFGEYCSIDDKGTKRYWRHSNHIHSNYALANLKEQIRCCMGSFLVKASVVKAYDIRFDLHCSYGEDLDFITRVLLASSDVLVERRNFTFYRERDTSAIHRCSFDRYSAFAGRMESLSFAKAVGNTAAADYIEQYSLAETVITVTRVLLLTNVPSRAVRRYIRQNDAMVEALRRAPESPYLSDQQKWYAEMILHHLWRYGVYVRWKYRYYEIRGRLGLLRRRWQANMGH